MPVIVTPTESLDEPTRADIIRVCVAAHAEPDFEHLFRYVPSGGLHFMAYEGDELVSHAVVTARWLIAPSDRRLRTGYVDAVATLPTFQGQGYGSAVMRQLAADIQGYDIGCLQTDRPGFYARLGWEVWRGTLGGIRAAEVIPTPEESGVMVLRTTRTPRLDLDGPLTVEWDGRIW